MIKVWRSQRRKLGQDNMPAKSAKQYKFMAAHMKGDNNSAIGPSPQVAREFVEKTPKAKRKLFMKKK